MQFWPFCLFLSQVTTLLLDLLQIPFIFLPRVSAQILPSFPPPLWTNNQGHGAGGQDRQGSTHQEGLEAVPCGAGEEERAGYAGAAVELSGRTGQGHQGWRRAAPYLLPFVTKTSLGRKSRAEGHRSPGPSGGTEERKGPI